MVDRGGVALLRLPPSSQPSGLFSVADSHQSQEAHRGTYSTRPGMIRCTFVSSSFQPLKQRDLRSLGRCIASSAVRGREVGLWRRP